MNIEMIDKWLNEEYGVSHTDLQEMYYRLLDKNIQLTEILEQALDRVKRIDKAIEYIESENTERFDNPNIEFALNLRKEKLLNILKGGNNE